MTVVLLALIAWRVGGHALVEGVRSLSMPVVAVGIMAGPVQVLLGAGRWRMTARLLGLRLSWGYAAREYARATFLNQVLPGGVLGDVARAWRLARVTDAPGTAVRATVLERAAGHVTLLATGAVAVGLHPALVEPVVRSGLLAALGLAVSGLAIAAAVAAAAAAAAVRATVRDVVRALLHPRALAAQLAWSAPLTASYIGVFLVAAHATGSAGTVAGWLPLVVVCMLAMAVPVSIGGWGVREGTAALVWAAAGLPAADGVAASVAYGVLALLGSLPAAVLLLGREDGRPPAASAPRVRPSS